MYALLKLKLSLRGVPVEMRRKTVTLSALVEIVLNGFVEVDWFSRQCPQAHLDAANTHIHIKNEFQLVTLIGTQENLCNMGSVAGSPGRFRKLLKPVRMSVSCVRTLSWSLLYNVTYEYY